MVNKKYEFWKKQASSIWRGVSYHPQSGSYEARIMFCGFKYFLGLFHDDLQAAFVYDAWCIKLGVPSRSNHARERWGEELPRQFFYKEICKGCKGTLYLSAKRLDNGEWVDAGQIDCPLCQQKSNHSS